MRNILKLSLKKQIQEYLLIIQKYQNDLEYVNPNVSLDRAKEILERLQKEYYLDYRID